MDPPPPPRRRYPNVAIPERRQIPRPTEVPPRICRVLQPGHLLQTPVPPRCHPPRPRPRSPGTRKTQGRSRRRPPPRRATPPATPPAPRRARVRALQALEKLKAEAAAAPAPVVEPALPAPVPTSLNPSPQTTSPQIGFVLPPTPQTPIGNASGRGRV